MILTLNEAYARIIDDDHVRSALITDPRRPDDPIVYCTQSFLTLTGYTEAEVLGHNCRFLQGPDTDRNTVAAIRDALHALTPITVDILNYRKDGTPFWNRLRLRPSFGAEGQLENFVGLQNAIDAAEVRPEPIYSFVD
jgi:PAS domain S-box-containing protein